MTKCPYTTEQLKAKAEEHRKMSLTKPGYVLDPKKSSIDTNYQITQETLAEVYEELAERRERNGE